MSYFISLFRNAKTPKPAAEVSIETALEYIKNNYDNVGYICDLLRSEKDKAKRTEIKKQLPAVTWSGKFSKRKKEDIETYSSIICMDIDDIAKKDLQRLKKEIGLDAYAVFTSPSGNGLKVLYETESKPDTHEQYFRAIATHMVNNFGVIIDESGKDVCRLCFLSFDPEIIINEAASIFSKKYMETMLDLVPAPPSKQKTEPKKAKPITPAPTVGIDYLQKCDEITRKNYQPVKGSYNNYIVTFSLFALRYNIDVNTTIFHLQSVCGEHDAKETKASVISTYAKFQNETGLWLKSHKATKQASQKVRDNVAQTNANDVNDEVKFWYEVENQTTKRFEYKFGYDDAIIFLHNNGFYRFPLENDYYQFIHVVENLKQVEVVQPIKIKDFFLNYLKAYKGEEAKAVREMFRRGAKNYCSINLLEGLDYYKPTFKKDTQTSAFVYFKNCYLEVNKDAISEKEYTNLDNYIWKKQVIDFNYKYSDYAQSDFNLFCTYAVVGAKKPVEELTDIDLKKIESLGTTIGYLLHRYKNPALTKAVVAVDKRLRSTGENNGRTGKSLLSKALAKMLNVCLIDGKNFKFDSPFPFQKANIDTELVNFNDVLKNFDFERLFGMITEEFTFEKKGKDSITLGFDDSPKFYISTNTTLKGSGESNKGRQQIIEFDNFFNTQHTPIIEFKRHFFNDWDDAEYSRFYSYMVDCIKYYLEHGLIEFPVENYEINKLIDAAGEEFIDFLNETVLEQLGHNREFQNKLLHKAFIEQNKHKEKLNIKTFNKWMHSWANVKHLDINIHKPGPEYRDRRNGIDYVTFTAKPIIEDEI